MAYAAIRESLLTQWQVTAAEFSVVERRSFDTTMRQLRRAESAELWEYVCISAGKLLEMLLIRWLVRTSPGLDISRAHGIGALLRIARDKHLFVTNTTLRSNEASLEATRLIRNSAAHYAFDAREATEIRATQALALLVCAAESLFPAMKIGEANPNHHDGLKSLLRLKRRDPITSAARDNVAASVRHAAQQTFRHLYNLTRILRQHDVDTRALGEEVAPQFGLIARRAAHASWRTIQDLGVAFHRLGLLEHARVLAILQPLDATFLSELMESRSPAEVRIYLERARRADRQLYRARLARGSIREPAIREFWRKVGTSPARVHRAVEVTRSLPVTGVAKVLSLADVDALVHWAESVRLPMAVMMLGMCTDRVARVDVRCEHIRTRLLQVLVDRISVATLLHLAPVLNAVRKANFAPGTRERPFFNAAIHRVATATPAERRSELSAVRRILWDIYAFGDSSDRDAAVRVADVVLRDHAGDLSWELLCLRGMLKLALAPCSLTDESISTDLIDKLHLPENADRWQVYLAVLGVPHFAYDTRFGKELFRRLRDLPLVTPAAERSEALYSAAISLIRTA